MRKIILASKSPRRHEILCLGGFDHEIKVSDADESLPDGLTAAESAREISKRKALAVKQELTAEQQEAVIIAADTVVEVGGEIFGKPKDEREAEMMLRTLSGKVHFVHTGITVIDGGRVYSEAVTTEVTVRELFDDEIKGYIASGEPMDKAGAYAVQGKGGAFVSSLKGDYFNVVGLPLCRISSILRECGIILFEQERN